jgi:hypothetical protein
MPSAATATNTNRLPAFRTIPTVGFFMAQKIRLFALQMPA